MIQYRSRVETHLYIYLKMQAACSARANTQQNIWAAAVGSNFVNVVADARPRPFCDVFRIIIIYSEKIIMKYKCTIELELRRANGIFVYKNFKIIVIKYYS